MSNETAGAAPATEMPADGGAVLRCQNVYLKDCSYESPTGRASTATGTRRSASICKPARPPWGRTCAR